MKSWISGLVLVAGLALLLTTMLNAGPSKEMMELAEVKPVPEGMEEVSLGAGCFWCIEAVLEQQEGIESIVSGYMGGEVENPSYQAVCSGTTGHAEVVRVVYDPKKLPFEHLLKWFWKLHDPTQLNRQGNDIGTQYRSAIFYTTEKQKETAEKSKKEADASGKFLTPIVTEITEASTFYPAEKYHQEYYQNNKNAGYCRFVILPKLEKLGLDK
jgi:methionine-S-sulfoxide reductase